MSFVIAAPEFMAAAATDLSHIGSAVSAANAAAAGPTTAVLAAGADEVSAAVASLFSGHAQAFQQLSAQAAAFVMPSSWRPWAGRGVPMRPLRRPTPRRWTPCGKTCGG
jgi:hypothetical protein